MGAKVIQNESERKFWLLFRQPGHVLYDYAVLYDQANDVLGGSVIDCPWLGRTFRSWNGSMQYMADFHAAIYAAVTALSGRVYAPDDGCDVQANGREESTFLDGAQWAMRRPLTWAGAEWIRSRGETPAVPVLPSSDRGLRVELSLGDLFGGLSSSAEGR